MLIVLPNLLQMAAWPGSGEKDIPVAGCLEGLLVDGMDKCSGPCSCSALSGQV